MSKPEKPKSWRDVIEVHPAADLFPMMSPDELKALGEDIKKNGMTHKVVMWSPENSNDVFLLDGRELPMSAGDLLVAPAGIPHGVRNTGSERLLVVAVLAPAPRRA